MISRRSWFAFLAIPVALAFVLTAGAQARHPVNASGGIDPTCTLATPCIEYDNSSSGPGVRGVSLLGNGLNGQTKFNSTSTTKNAAGVLGNDLSTSGAFDSGVKGVSVRGSGVSGTSTSGAGVSGTSSSGSGVSGSSTTGAGAVFISVSAPGIVAETGEGVASNNQFGVFGDDLSASGTSNFGVVGESTNGTGTNGFSTSGTGVSGTALKNSGVSGFTSTGGAFPYAVVGSCGCPTALSGIGVAGFAGTLGTGVYGTGLTAVWADGNGSSEALLVDQRGTGLLITARVGTTDVMSLDQSGNMIIKGSLTQHGTPLVATRTSSGTRVTTFSAQQTVATIEDFGQAKLIQGQAYVRIDRTFASTIDPRVGYLVFLTPGGDSRGLYVVNRTPSGFLVRENQGGRSTLAFDYRIVAHPLNATLSRLPPAPAALHTTGLMAAPKPPPPPSFKPIAPALLNSRH